MSAMLDAALAYANHGLQVIPIWGASGGKCACGDLACRSPAKHPLVDRGVHDASSDHVTIKEWFSGSAQFNIAVRTGNGLVVIDEDQPGAILQAGIELVNSPCVRTARGRHFWFASNGVALPSRTGIAPGVDVRADRGYVLAPPSQHVTGASYAWVAGHSLSDLALPELPAELARLIVAAAGSNGAASGDRDLFGRLKIEALIEQLETMPPNGDWRGTMLKLIGSLIGRRLPDDLILSIARRGTRKDLGFDHEQTDMLVEDLIRSTRRRWDIPEPEDTFDQRDDECDKSDLSDKSPWPDPLDPAALYGLAGDVVRAIEPHSEADPVALLLQLLSAFGNAAGRGHYLLVEGDRHPPQIWPVLVGKTAKARKGTSWGRLLQLLEIADPYWAKERRMSGLSSGEGVIWAVRDKIVTRIKNKQTGDYDLEEVDPGVADKRLFVLEAEFASPLRHMERTGNTLSSTLRCLWDRGDVGSMTKNSPARTTGAMTSVVGHIVADELQRYLTRTELANGMANRLLFACVKRSKELPFGGEAVELGPLATRLTDRLQRIALRGEQRVLWTDAAREIWRDVYSDLSADRPGLLGAVTSRAEAQTLRLALVYALLDNKIFLEPAHLQAALAVWRYCDQSAAHLFGRAMGNPLADEIRRALDSAGRRGLTRTQIRDLFKRHQGREALGRALELLEEQGLARRETSSTGGRPEERWFAQ